jgi:methyl-accepting chemotaxis protein
METILNFIKETLAGKKMDAKWIVTLGIAIGGIVWAGTLALQIYDTTMADIKALKSSSHTKVSSYDESDVIHKISKNKDNVATLTLDINSLKVKIDILMRDVDRNRDAVTGNGNPLSL